MLHLATVEPNTLELLKKLQSIPELANYRLVGGTALALRLGHRKSVDLDLFCHATFNSNKIRDALNKNKIKLDKANSSDVFFGGYIDDIKVDFVKDIDGWIRPAEIIDGVRLASMEDLAPMKLNAVTGRGRRRDFVDLFYLLKRFSVSDLLNLYTARTKMEGTFHVLMSMTYFEDAEDDEMPYMFDKKITWGKIKKQISKQVLSYSNSKPNI